MKKTFLKIILLIYIAVFLNLFLFSIVSAVDYVPLAPIAGKIDTVNFTGQPTDLSNYLNNLYKLLVGVAGVLAVIMIMWGGIEYMSTDAIGGKEEAKSRINNALLGLMIALGSFLILQTINKQFLNTTLKIDTVKAPTLDPVTFVGPDGAGAGKITPSGTTISGGSPTYSAFKDAAWNEYALGLINQSGLPTTVVANPEQFFPGNYINSDGTVQAEGWVNYLAGIANKESGFNPNDTYTENFKDSSGNYVKSVGLLSMSQESAKGYGFNYTTEQLKDPYNNLQVGVKILDKWVQKDGVVAGKSGSGYVGAARYWSVVRPK